MELKFPLWGSIKSPNYLVASDFFMSHSVNFKDNNSLNETKEIPMKAPH